MQVLKHPNSMSAAVAHKLVGAAVVAHGFALAAASPADRPKIQYDQTVELRKALVPATAAGTAFGLAVAATLRHQSQSMIIGLVCGSRVGVAGLALVSLCTTVEERTVRIEKRWKARGDAVHEAWG